jgi:3-oxoacyl-[acyl-carrier-protein] synthase-3
MIPMKATILGLGEWVPEAIRSNEDWPITFGQERASAEEDRILAEVNAKRDGSTADQIVARYLKSEAGDPFLGTQRRRIAPDDMTSCEAETRAAKAALLDAGIEGKDVDVVLAYAAVPDHISPPSATRVAYNVGATNAYACGMHTACASAIVQMDLAASLIESGRARFALLCQSFLMTRVFPFEHPASPNIGDGATAIVVGPSEHPGILPVYAVTSGEYYDSVVWRRRGEDNQRWYEAGGPMFLSTNDPQTARKLIQDTVTFGEQTVRAATAKCGLNLKEIDLFACVQPREWVPRAIAEAAGLSVDAAPTTFQERAHLGACGVVTNLIEARRRGILREGALVAMYGQGAGFTRAAGLLRWGAR